MPAAKRSNTIANVNKTVPAETPIIPVQLPHGLDVVDLHPCILPGLQSQHFHLATIGGEFPDLPASASRLKHRIDLLCATVFLAGHVDRGRQGTCDASSVTSLCTSSFRMPAYPGCPTGDVGPLGRLDDLGRNLLRLEGLGKGVEMVRFLHPPLSRAWPESTRPRD